MPPKPSNRSFTDDFLDALNDQRVVDSLRTVFLPFVTSIIKDKVDEAVMPLNVQISYLTDQNKLLEERIEELDRYSRSYNIIINGLNSNSYSQAASASSVSNSSNINVGDQSQASEPSATAGPSTSHVNTMAMVNKFFTDALGIEIGSQDISAAHLLPKKIQHGSSTSSTVNTRFNSSIIVRFNSKQCRDHVFYARKSLKGSGVYINEHLTPRNNELFVKARQLLKVKKVAGAWTSNGNIYIKLGTSPDSRPIRVRQLTDMPI